LVVEIEQLGFDKAQVANLPRFDRATLHTVRDPFTGVDDIRGDWYDGSGQRIGSLQFHRAGTFFAEFDVVKPHSRDPRWFVEGVAAWAKDASIKSEPNILPAMALE
jgi:hypothetical protein